jgi:glycine/D-amino acid oxidase-like deaminating enzyme
VFNCTGLGSKNLFRDKSLKGVKGQLLLLEPADLDFAFGAGDYCMIPRTDHLILGSLFLTEYDSELPTQENQDNLWSEITRWCQHPNSVISLPADVLSKDKIKGTIAGIRPYRSKGIRIELEHLETCDKYVIHDYGHGGGGITLSWGCAMHAVSLLDKIPAL